MDGPRFPPLPSVPWHTEHHFWKDSLPSGDWACAVQSPVRQTSNSPTIGKRIIGSLYSNKSKDEEKPVGKRVQITKNGKKRKRQRHVLCENQNCENSVMSHL